MIERIRVWLIHALGGVTEDGAMDREVGAYTAGIAAAREIAAASPPRARYEAATRGPT